MVGHVFSTHHFKCQIHLDKKGKVDYYTSHAYYGDG
jgi:hypothetical protein